MPRFYDLNEDERIALTHRAIREGRSVVERWEQLAFEEAKGWEERAALAAEWLRGADAVADLGCGVMTLEKYLTAEQAYIPVDIVARDDRTIVCDFNVTPVPETDATVAVCLGVIEYILQPRAFLLQLRDKYESIVLTYCITDAQGSLGPRRSHAWVNDFTRAEMEDEFALTGWLIEKTQAVDDYQQIWKLSHAGAK